MNPFKTAFGLIANFFLAGSETSKKREQQGPEGMEYDADLKAEYVAANKARLAKESGGEAL